MRPRVLYLIAVACSGDPRPASAPVDPAALPPVTRSPAPDDAYDPRSLEDTLAALRARDLAATAAVIAKRVAQRPAKMRLTAEQGSAAAMALLELADREAIRALHAVMPRSTVELARGVSERGVAAGEAETIARYLVGVVQVLAFERLHVFDENRSHVIGREWHEIDYTGENMTSHQRASAMPRRL